MIDIINKYVYPYTWKDCVKCIWTHIYTNDINKHSHIYNNGICNICNKACTHGKYENGICSECNYGVEEPQLVDGYYEISSYGNLIWFQRYVDAGNT